MSQTRIYVVVNRTTGEKRLVEATSQSQAVRHCTLPHYDVKVASAKEVGYSGLKVEIAEAIRDNAQTTT